jgi:hypothetical protein
VAHGEITQALPYPFPSSLLLCSTPAVPSSLRFSQDLREFITRTSLD